MHWEHMNSFTARWQSVNGNRFVRLAVPALLGIDMASTLLKTHHNSYKTGRKIILKHTDHQSLYFILAALVERC